MGLTHHVHVAPGIPTEITDLPPDLDRRWWSPITSTLITGERDAVLVDALLTGDQAERLADDVEASGRNLTTVYVTHGHGDHWFGLGTLLRRFPQARAVATATVLEHARAQGAPDFVASFWEPRFPGQLPTQLVLPEPLSDGVLELEGQELRVVELGHTDTDDTTALHVPSSGLLVAGDAVYNDVHLYLAESPAAERGAWLAALDTLEALETTTVVAGHKRPGRADSPADIAATRRYLHDFDDLACTASDTLELYRGLVSRHPDRVNAGAAWGSARSAIHRP
jgi:glyoxylase-like metal-dependent hydrolase (beta-lactamase superfamily II)